MTAETDEHAGSLELDQPVALHPLTFLDEGEEWTVGRADTNSYCVLPADGATLLQRLADGQSPRAVARWYTESYGETVDMVEFLEAMDELGFLVAANEIRATVTAVRWQRLGRVMFSRVAMTCYALVIVFGAVLMARHHDLAPRYTNLFFSSYMTIVVLGVFFGQFPLLLVHEWFHTLAGRRLGLSSSLGIGRRLYFMVFETSLDGLVAVPRRKRYLPILAGMLADLLVVAIFTVVAWLLRRPDGSQPVVGAICLAMAFATLLRFAWQFYFYLQTDLYLLIVTALGCVDLHKTARRTLANRVNRLLGRTDRLLDETAWHPRDRKVARWYSYLLLLGYVFSFATLLLVGIPTTVRLLVVVFSRLVDGHFAGWAGLLDSLAFLLINVAQFAVVGVVLARERRRKRAAPQPSHVID
jgi:hypothetical protein